MKKLIIIYVKYVKKKGDKVSNLKIQIGCFYNIVMKQFNHINKYIGERLKEYFERKK